MHVFDPGMHVHPQKLDSKIFVDGPSVKIESLENFRLYCMYSYAS